MMKQFLSKPRAVAFSEQRFCQENLRHTRLEEENNWAVALRVQVKHTENRFKLKKRILGKEESHSLVLEETEKRLSKTCQFGGKY